MKGLIMNKPKDPIDFLINKLQSQEGKYKAESLWSFFECGRFLLKMLWFFSFLLIVDS